MRRNIKIIVEYDGTGYSGWQRQATSPSIQEELEEGLYKITGEKTHIIGAGRTDSGVHARGQVANFYTASSIPSHKFSFAFNAVIPYDIRVKNSEEAEPDFHAQLSAKARHYRYTIATGPHGPAIGRDYTYHVPGQLDVDAMKIAAETFKGTHDFSAFRAAGSTSKTTVRTLYHVSLREIKPYLFLDIVGNGFLYNMVRIIAGTLVNVGKGKIGYNKIENIIKSGDRQLSGPTAPARGLCLQRVYYDGKDEDFALDTPGPMY